MIDIASEKHLTQLKKLSTESLIIWIVGRSTELGRVFTIEEIVLEAWEINREKHSMRGYPQYPDSFVIIKRIFDMKGRKGHLTGSPQNGFKLTPLSKEKFEGIKQLLLEGKIKKIASKNSADR